MPRDRNTKLLPRIRYSKREEDNTPSLLEMRRRRYEDVTRFLIANMRLNGETRKALIAGKIPEAQVAEMLALFEMPLYLDADGGDERSAPLVEAVNTPKRANPWGQMAGAVAARDLMEGRAAAQAKRAGKPAQNWGAMAGRDLLKQRNAAQTNRPHPRSRLRPMWRRFRRGWVFGPSRWMCEWTPTWRPRPGRQTRAPSWKRAWSIWTRLSTIRAPQTAARMAASQTSGSLVYQNR